MNESHATHTQGARHISEGVSHATITPLSIGVNHTTCGEHTILTKECLTPHRHMLIKDRHMLIKESSYTCQTVKR